MLSNSGGDESVSPSPFPSPQLDKQGGATVRRADSEQIRHDAIYAAEWR